MPFHTVNEIVKTDLSQGINIMVKLMTSDQIFRNRTGKLPDKTLVETPPILILNEEMLVVSKPSYTNLGIFAK